MLIEAVQDGGQAMRDPVGGSVEFHFVPILKLISTLLIMGVFDDEDVTNILKLIEPTVFNTKKAEEPVEESSKVKEEKEQKAPTKVKEDPSALYHEENGYEEEFEDDDMGEKEDEMEELEETESLEQDEEIVDKSEPVNGEKGAEETEKETKSGEAKEHFQQGLFQMKLPESVKLQV